MSKKKNTLNDLEAFLKMQASALVTPPALETKAETVQASLTPTQNREEATKEVAKNIPAARPVLNSESDIIHALQQLSLLDKKAFYELVIKATESLPNKEKEDTLLINTALYLKGGPNWKETVRNYWKK